MTALYNLLNSHSLFILCRNMKIEIIKFQRDKLNEIFLQNYITVLDIRLWIKFLWIAIYRSYILVHSYNSKCTCCKLNSTLLYWSLIKVIYGLPTHSTKLKRKPPLGFHFNVKWRALYNVHKVNRKIALSRVEFYIPLSTVTARDLCKCYIL